MIVRCRAPLRLGLAGGGTDVSPYSELYGGAVLNATVDLYAYTIIEPCRPGRVRFATADRDEFHEGEAGHPLELDGKLDLHKGVYNRIVRDFNRGEPLSISVQTYADVPAGSGLGSSSALVVSMVRCYAELLGLPLGDYEIAHLAYEIERVDLGLHGGKQDQYAATFGGFNFIEFNASDRVIVNPLRIKNWIVSEFEASLVLFYTGASRSSAAIIERQIENVEQRDRRSIAAMERLKAEAIQMKEALLLGDLERFAGLMGDSWRAKKATASGITNDEIESVLDVALQAGARAGKVSGAGGGGFMMFLADPSRRIAVARALSHLDGHVIPCHFTKLGTQAWKIL
jgi:D-glycero-alpha-D-manno-heptose-7-phosphate kinase